MKYTIKENYVWYWPIREAFRRHQEESHFDKGWSEIQDEVRYFEEALHYEKREDGQEDCFGCCWVGCTWQVKFETRTVLTQMKEGKKDETTFEESHS